MKKAKIKIPQQTFKEYPGYLFSFFVGHYSDKIEVAFWDDDGTRAKHITFYYKDIPVGTIPIINEDGLSTLIKLLIEAYKTLGWDEKKLSYE